MTWSPELIGWRGVRRPSVLTPPTAIAHLERWHDVYDEVWLASGDVVQAVLSADRATDYSPAPRRPRTGARYAQAPPMCSPDILAWSSNRPLRRVSWNPLSTRMPRIGTGGESDEPWEDPEIVKLDDWVWGA